MTTKKIALDASAESYWENYFGPYGKAWTRTIPRRIASKVIAKVAAVRADAPAVVVPHAVSVQTDRVLVEGTVRTATKTGRLDTLFAAAFDHDGRMLSLDTVALAV